MSRIVILKIFMVIIQNLGAGDSEWTCIWEVGGVAGATVVALRKVSEMRISKRKESTVSKAAAGYGRRRSVSSAI